MLDHVLRTRVIHFDAMAADNKTCAGGVAQCFSTGNYLAH